MAVRDLMNQGYARRYAWQRSMGMTDAQIAQDWQTINPGEQWATVQAAVRHARAALAAGTLFGQMQVNQRLAAGAVPRAGGQGLNYRYNVAVRWIEGQTGTVRRTLLTITRADSMTPQELAAEIAQQFQNAMQGRGRLFGSKDVRQGSTLDTWRVLTVERA